LIRELGIKDTEIFYETSYAAAASYRASRNAEVENRGYGMMLYNNLYEGFSPKSKNTRTIMTL
jgi:hypothetical protein